MESTMSEQMTSEQQLVATVADGSPMRCLADILRQRAIATPEAIAIDEGDAVDGGGTVTYAELDRRASQVASGLVAAGLIAGDRVAFVGRNSAALLEVLHGAVRCGAIPVPLNNRLAAPELAGVLADADPAVIVVDDSAPAIVPGPNDRSAPLRLTVWRSDTPNPGEPSYGRWRDEQQPHDPGVVADPDATQLILYTSGTTGRPKGIELTGTNLAYALRAMQQTLDVDTTSVAMAPIPFFHVAGLGLALLAALDGGRLLVRDLTGPDALLHTLIEHRVSHAAVVPTVLQQLLARPDTRRADWKALRCIVYGASPIPLPVLVDATEVFGCDFLQGYGLTESTGGICVLSPEDHRAVAAEGRPDLLRSAGKPRPGTRLRVVDPATGLDVGPGVRGEVWIAGPSVMKGYWRQPELTAQTVVEGGWLRTGDGGSIDAEGFVWLHDRIKDMIVSGGENIYPVEVESVLTAHPSVLEVAVVGIPSERWGESPFAYVVARDGCGTTEADGSAILTWARERLAHYKVPVGLRFVDALPRTASGKIVKARLRAEQQGAEQQGAEQQGAQPQP
jgi:acyl-CoA synthetase (AMP-forming)/AMP-acid ligase II